VHGIHGWPLMCKARQRGGRRVARSEVMCVYQCGDDSMPPPPPGGGGSVVYVCMYVKIRRHQHTRVHAYTGPRRHTKAPACHIVCVWCNDQLYFFSVCGAMISYFLPRHLTSRN